MMEASPGIFLCSYGLLRSRDYECVGEAQAELEVIKITSSTCEQDKNFSRVDFPSAVDYWAMQAAASAWKPHDVLAQFASLVHAPIRAAYIPFPRFLSPKYSSAHLIGSCAQSTALGQ